MKTYIKPSNCSFFKSTGKPFGGCKRPETKDACLFHNANECVHYESRNKKHNGFVKKIKTVSISPKSTPTRGKK